MKNKVIIFISVFMFMLLLHNNVIAENEEYFTFEIGSILPSTLNEIKTTEYDLLGVSQIGYLKIKDNKFMHIFWGSLNDVYNERTSYLFNRI